MMSAEDKSAKKQLEAVLLNYFDGLYFNDLGLLGRIFHPKAQYTCANQGAFLVINMEEYFEILKQRTAPAKLNQQRMDKILWLDVHAPHTALAKVQCTIAPKFFTDYLAFINSEDKGWQIISKTFSYTINQT